MKMMLKPKEFGPVINFRQMPVVRLDVSKRDEYGLTGAPVLIDNGTFRSGEPYYLRARIRSYIDEEHFTVVQGSTCLSDTHSYEDMEEELMYANAPLIKPGEEFVLAVVNSEKRTYAPPIVVKAGSQVSSFCTTPLTIEKVEWRMFVDEDKEKYIMAGSVRK